MKKLALILALAAPFANAAYCTSNSYGGTTSTDCADGNHYQTQISGNTSTTYGNNINTGSTWNQTTTDMGNGFSSTYGTDANGDTWYETCYTDALGNQNCY